MSKLVKDPATVFQKTFTIHPNEPGPKSDTWNGIWLNITRSMVCRPIVQRNLRSDTLKLVEAPTDALMAVGQNCGFSGDLLPNKKHSKNIPKNIPMNSGFSGT